MGIGTVKEERYEWKWPYLCLSKYDPTLYWVRQPSLALITYSQPVLVNRKTAKSGTKEHLWSRCQRKKNAPAGKHRKTGQEESLPEKSLRKRTLITHNVKAGLSHGLNLATLDALERHIELMQNLPLVPTATAIHLLTVLEDYWIMFSLFKKKTSQNPQPSLALVSDMKNTRLTIWTVMNNIESKCNNKTFELFCGDSLIRYIPQ